MRGKLERQLLGEGLLPIGVDEVGRGCIAGPVYAACVSLDYGLLRRLPAKVRNLIRDSKTLSTRQRRSVIESIHACSLKAQVAHATVQEIERLGIAPATFLAMRRAIAGLVQSETVLLIDGNRPLPSYDGAQRAIVKGDNLCYAIAAASILAKEARDDYMRQQASLHPQYGFEKHVGYGTKGHLEMIATHGICELHRRNFAPVAEYQELAEIHVQ